MKLVHDATAKPARLLPWPIRGDRRSIIVGLALRARRAPIAGGDAEHVTLSTDVVESTPCRRLPRSSTAALDDL
jgi:hypothetical protein